MGKAFAVAVTRGDAGIALEASPPSHRRQT